MTPSFLLIYILSLVILAAGWVYWEISKNPHGATPTPQEAEAQTKLDVTEYEAHRKASINPPTGWPAVPITNPDAKPGDPYP